MEATQRLGIQLLAQIPQVEATRQWVEMQWKIVLLRITTPLWGIYNLAVGGLAGQSCTTGGSNTFIGGYLTGGGTTGGNNNTLIGYASGYNTVTNTTGSQNTFVGTNTHGSIAGAAGQICIGNDVTCAGDNTFSFGQNSQGVVSNVYAANASWARGSDVRLKKDIEDNTDCGLAFINELRPVTFKWKAPSEVDSDMPNYNPDKTEPTYTSKMYGLIAQEVKAALDKHNITDFGGWDKNSKDVQLISQEMFIHPLIKAVQELSAEVEKLKKGD